MIYSGLGLLSLGIYGIVFFAFWLASFYLTRDANFFFDRFWLTFPSFAIAGLCVWFFGRWLNGLNPLQVQEFIDGERRVVLKPRHTIYTLEMEYWGFIFAALSVLILFAKKLNLF